MSQLYLRKKFGQERIVRKRALGVLALGLLFTLSACGSIPTLPCNTPTPLSGSDENEFRYAKTRGAAAASAAAGVPASSVSSALGAFRCPEKCPFQSVTGVTFAVTGTDSEYSVFRSAGDFFFQSWYIGEADYNWSAIAQCTTSQVPNPPFGTPATAPCPGAAITITAQANSRTEVGIRVGGTVLCGPGAGTPVTPAGVTITYPDGVSRLVRTNATGNFSDLRRDFDGGGTVTIVVTGSDNVNATLTITILTGGP